MLNADSPAFPEEKKKEDLNEVQISTLVGVVQSRFRLAQTAKQPHEDRAITAYNNFRGLYDKNVRFRESEKCRIFVKATKTKVLAGYGHVVDIVFNGERFPVGVGPTEVPEGVEDVAHISATPLEPEADTAVEPNPLDVGYKGDGKEVPAGATFGSGFWNKLLPNKKKDLIQKGPSPSPEKPSIRPADEAAYKMDKLIQDQLTESEAVSEVSNALLECNILGTGVIKGPFTYTKTVHKWVKDDQGNRTYTPVKTRVPRIEYVSFWDIYPDPNATCKKEMSYFIHRHRMNESQLRGLMKMPLFKKDKIESCLTMGPNYVKQSYEDQVTSNSGETVGRDFRDRYEVLEYWGLMGVKEAKEQGLDVGGLDELEEIQINAWVCGGFVLRVVVNPFTPVRIPYHIFNYEKNPYSIFGVGIPENMSDSQAMMNGHARMAVDNLALAGGLVFDIDEAALVPGQDTQIYNGKIFYRQAGSTGQAVYGIKFPNTAQENLMVFDKFRQIADEETGIPSFSHGQLGVTGMTRTASGMSMLMGAASLTIKTVIKNLDQQLFKPLGDDLFQWNMQFFEGDLPIEGDLEIKALATNSLMQKEVRSQRLTMFLQTVANPAFTPFAKIPYIIEELAKSLDLDKDKILNTSEEARAYAAIIGLQNNATQAGGQAPALGEQPSPLGAPNGVPPVGGAEGVTGNGNATIGTGAIPQAGEAEFSG